MSEWINEWMVETDDDGPFGWMVGQRVVIWLLAAATAHFSYRKYQWNIKDWLFGGATWKSIYEKQNISTDRPYRWMQRHVLHDADEEWLKIIHREKKFIKSKENKVNENKIPSIFRKTKRKGQNKNEKQMRSILKWNVINQNIKKNRRQQK